VLYVFSVGLLGRLLQIMLELKKRTRELHDANLTLEERVDERTLKLSAANLALKVEIVERERAEVESQSALAQPRPRAGPRASSWPTPATRSARR
jgi:C4-dicarboxylate-specific signal transduction histidine kinase